MKHHTSHGTVIKVESSYQGISWARMAFWLAVFAVVLLCWSGGIACIVRLMRALGVGQ